MRRRRRSSADFMRNLRRLRHAALCAMARVDVRNEPSVDETDQVSWRGGIAGAYRSLDLDAAIHRPLIWVPVVAVSAWLGQVTLFPSGPVYPALVRSLWILLASCLPAGLMLLAYQIRWRSAMRADFVAVGCGALGSAGLFLWSPYHPDRSTISTTMIALALVGGFLLRRIRKADDLND